jgi:hypothetical protein
VGVDDQWHSGWSLFLCSVARCLGVGACSQAYYPGMFCCICRRDRQKIYKEVGECVACCLCLGSIGGTYAGFCGVFSRLQVLVVCVACIPCWCLVGLTAGHIGIRVRVRSCV